MYINRFIPTIQNPIERLVWIMNSNYDILIKGIWILCYSGQTREPAGWGGGTEGSKGWADHKKRSKCLTISYLNFKIELHLTCLKWIDTSNNVITSPNGLRLNFKLIWKSLADIFLKKKSSSSCDILLWLWFLAIGNISIFLLLLFPWI